MLNSSQKEGHQFKSPGHWGPFVWRLHGLPLPLLVLPRYSSFLPKFKGENLVSLRYPSEILFVPHLFFNDIPDTVIDIIIRLLT